MNQALGEVNSKIIKEARINSAKVLCFMRDNKVDRKTVLFADCRAVSDLVADCEFKRINSLAELCSTVFINQNHAECIKQLGRLSKRIDELLESK